MDAYDRVRRSLDSLPTTAAMPAGAEDVALPPAFESAVDETVAYLGSRAAHDSLAADPYWPKWDSPWWRMTLLVELGLADRIPAASARALAESCRRTYLPIFPVRAEEVPPGVDTHREVACHCAVGTLVGVLRSCGVDPDEPLPWIRPWFPRYALPDGGLNCDEAVYVRPEPHSSVLSTLPPLEALLRWTRRPLRAEEEATLDRGAEYLIRRRLCRSISKGGIVMKESWLAPCFPRFYDYDLLRGLSFLVAWAEDRRRALPATAVVEAVEVLAARVDGEGRLAPGRRAYEGARTLRRDAAGVWTKTNPAATFPLLEEASAVGRPSRALTRAWRAAVAGLRRLVAAGQVVGETR
ncbi:MAG: hypothetical protein HYZ53_18485 [Planctomycetes bacterium]|nr:hypothetical protein [Planctomycetota bacterium]